MAMLWKKKENSENVVFVPILFMTKKKFLPLALDFYNWLEKILFS